MRLPRQTATLLLCGSLLACGPEDAPPRQVGTTLPTVSFKYRGDRALIEARRTAAIYCERYFATPRAARHVNGLIGESVVVFECVKADGLPADAWPRHRPLWSGIRSDE